MWHPSYTPQISNQRCPEPVEPPSHLTHSPPRDRSRTLQLQVHGVTKPAGKVEVPGQSPQRTDPPGRAPHGAWVTSGGSARFFGRHKRDRFLCFFGGGTWTPVPEVLKLSRPRRISGETTDGSAMGCPGKPASWPRLSDATAAQLVRAEHIAWFRCCFVSKASKMQNVEERPNI